MSYNHITVGQEALDAVKTTLSAIGMTWSELPPTKIRTSHGELELRAIFTEAHGVEVAFEEYLEVDDDDCDGVSSVNVRVRQ